jgi:NitT/TauT family transport system substrate-binding protein
MPIGLTTRNALRRVFKTFFLLIGLAILAGGEGCDRIHNSEPLAEVRIALNPWPGYSFMYIAEEKGFFRDEGLSVRFLELASLADARRVFEQGQANLICCTLVEAMLMNELAGENRIKVIAPFDYSCGSDMLLAKSDVSSVEAIRGRRIGLEPETVDGLAVFLALKSAGLRFNDVTIVPLAQSEMIEALNSGAVDAVQTYPPNSEEIMKLSGMHSIWNSSQSPGLIMDVLAAYQDFLSSHPDAVDGVLRAYQRSLEFYRQHPQEALAILTRRCGLSEQSILSYLNDMKLLAWDDPSSRRIFEPDNTSQLVETVAEGLVTAGMLRQPPPVSLLESRIIERLFP